MKLTHLKDPPATVVVLQPGDGLMPHGYCHKGLMLLDGCKEDCEIITFTAGPGRHQNDVEIYIPESMAKKIRDAIGAGVPGMVKL